MENACSDFDEIENNILIAANETQAAAQMQMIELELNGKSLRFANDEPLEISVVGDNNDYCIHFTIDNRRNAMCAVFVRDGKEEAVLIDENDRVNIPMWVLKSGTFEVGVTSDGFASKSAKIRVWASIIDEKNAPAKTPEPSVFEQLIKLANKLKKEEVGIENVYVNDDGELLLQLIDGSEVKCFKADNTLQFNKNGVLSVKTADKIEAGNTLPASSALIHVEIGYINTLLSTI